MCALCNLHGHPDVLVHCILLALTCVQAIFSQPFMQQPLIPHLLYIICEELVGGASLRDMICPSSAFCSDFSKASLPGAIENLS